MIRLLFKIFKWTCGVLLSLFIIGYLWEHILRWQYESSRPDEGEFVTLQDGRQLHFYKEGAGNATVIFESGIGGDYRHWQEIQQQVSFSATTISYDRAGILWSDRSDSVSLERYSSDLFQLLEKTNCPKPYILVGHSFAGITLRKFIQDHAADIGGIVFIDVSHPEQITRSSEKLRQSVVPPPSYVLKFLNATGLIRLMFTLAPFTHDVPEDHWFNKDARSSFYKILSGLQQEMEHDDALMAATAKINDFGSIPLAVITAAYPKGVEQISNKELEQEYLAIHKTLQMALLDLSDSSKQVMADESGHYITLQQPDLIVNEIKKLLERFE